MNIPGRINEGSNRRYRSDVGTISQFLCVINDISIRFHDFLNKNEIFLVKEKM
jgi:hypothetical protein